MNAAASIAPGLAASVEPQNPKRSAAGVPEGEGFAGQLAAALGVLSLGDAVSPQVEAVAVAALAAAAAEKAAIDGVAAEDPVLEEPAPEDGSVENSAGQESAVTTDEGILSLAAAVAPAGLVPERPSSEIDAVRALGAASAGARADGGDGGSTQLGDVGSDASGQAPSISPTAPSVSLPSTPVPLTNVANSTATGTQIPAAETGAANGPVSGVGGEQAGPQPGQSAPVGPAAASALTLTGSDPTMTSPPLPITAPAPSPTQAIASPAAPATAAQQPTLAEQLATPLLSLRTAPHGEHVVTLQVTPAELGPVTVRAHIGADGIRMELVAPTDAARDALRAIAADLRRDMAASGMAGQLDVSAGSGGGGGTREGAARNDAADRRAADLPTGASAAVAPTPATRASGDPRLSLDVYA